MRLCRSWKTICLLAIALSSNLSGEPVYFQPPGALHSCAVGINESGDIAGWYQVDVDPGPGVRTVQHGYVLKNGVFTTVDPPAANWAGTVIARNNAQGDVAGWWWTTTPTVSYGFTIRAGVLTNLSYPGASNTFGNGINNQGDVVGSYTLPNDNRMYGFRSTRSGEYLPTLLPFADATVVRPWGINSRGDIAGVYSRPDGYQGHAFVLTRYGEFLTLAPPGPPGQFSRAVGITEQGWVSGDYVALVNGVNVTRAFVWKNGQITTYDLPGALVTLSREMSSSGRVVGCAVLPHNEAPPSTRTCHLSRV